jgi:uncharacterized YccA/Bax inhibitor family protein
MALLRTSNPAFSRSAWQSRAGYADAMTVSGAVNKTGILMLLAFATACWQWSAYNANPASVGGWMMLGLFGGLIVAFATVFKPMWAPLTAPLYALLEGLVLGGISAMFNARFAGLPAEAVGVTFGVLAIMLLAYQSGLVRPTARFQMGVVAATGGVVALYFGMWILSFFGVHLTALTGSGPIGIGFSVLVCAIAALNLVLDFGLIQSSAAQGAPRYMEWYSAFALLLTLVWLYIEILNLLAKMRD